MNAAIKSKLPQKVCLSGADNFYLMLDYKAQKAKAGHNVLRMVFYFNSAEVLQPFIEKIKQSPIIYWFCNIQLVSGMFFQKPYWLYADKGIQPVFKEQTHAVENEIPLELLNRKISLNGRLIEFDSIKYPSGKIALVMSWHHIIMDGRGSGFLIRHLNNDTVSDETALNAFFPKPDRKVGLLFSVKNMYEVRDFVQESSFRPITTIATKPTTENATFRLKTIQFTISETELIDANAKQNGARFGANVFLIAACAHVINLINKNRNKPGTIWLPVPYDGRKRGGNGPLVTNNISFLFYRLVQSDLCNIKQTTDSINAQMALQLKIGMPYKYSLLLNLMRHIPLSLYSFLTTFSSRGVVASFLYSSAGEDLRDMNTLMQQDATDIVVIPPFIYPPGLAFSFLRHHNCLKMNIAYCESSINKNELNLIEASIKEILLGKY